MKYLIVVDMQNDFTTGSLGSPHAAAIIPNVVQKVKSFDGTVIFPETHMERIIFSRRREENFLSSIASKTRKAGRFAMNCFRMWTLL